jgi:hypothetical protein
MSSELDILSQVQSMDLSKVETSFPILKTGVVKATVTECKFDKDEAKADAKPYLHVKYALAQPWETQPIDGVPSKPINPGFGFTQRIYVGTYEKDGETKWYGVDQLARLRESAFGVATPGSQFKPEEMIGQEVTVKLKFDPAPKNTKTGQVYGPQTTVDGFVRKAK